MLFRSVVVAPRSVVDLVKGNLLLGTRHELRRVLTLSLSLLLGSLGAAQAVLLVLQRTGVLDVGTGKDLAGSSVACVDAAILTSVLFSKGIHGTGRRRLAWSPERQVLGPSRRLKRQGPRLERNACCKES